MFETLIVLNNYFNDFFVSMVLVTAIVSSRFVRYGVKAGDAESLELVRYALERLNKVFIVVVICVIAGAFVRYIFMAEVEMVDAARNGQVLAVRVKYVMLIILFTTGIIIRSLSTGRRTV